MTNSLGIAEPCVPDLINSSEYTILQQNQDTLSYSTHIDPVDVTEDIGAWSEEFADTSQYYLMKDVDPWEITWSGASNGDCPFTHGQAIVHGVDRPNELSWFELEASKYSIIQPVFQRGYGHIRCPLAIKVGHPTEMALEMPTIMACTKQQRWRGWQQKWHGV